MEKQRHNTLHFEYDRFHVAYLVVNDQIGDIKGDRPYQTLKEMGLDGVRLE